MWLSGIGMVRLATASSFSMFHVKQQGAPPAVERGGPPAVAPRLPLSWTGPAHALKRLLGRSWSAAATWVSGPARITSPGASRRRVVGGSGGHTRRADHAVSRCVPYTDGAAARSCGCRSRQRDPIGWRLGAAPRPAGEAPSVSTWSRSEQDLSFIPSRSSLVGADVPLTVVTDAATPLHAGADADVAVLHGRTGAVPGQLQPVSNDASSLRCMNGR